MAGERGSIHVPPFDPDVDAEVRRRAKAKGLTPGQWVNHVIARAVRHELEAQARHTAEPRWKKGKGK